MGNIVEIKNIRKVYKEKVAVDGLNLELHDDEVFGLLGPNGAGKTTLIKMLTCLERPTSGTATVCGYDILKDPISVKECIAVSPQETAVARNLTPLENLEMIAEICGKDKKKALELAEKFGLMKQPKTLAKNLSGGNQRRLSIAMAIITEPKVLFLDEPTLGLDIEARYDLWDVIKELKKTTSIVLTTHYLEEADALSDRIGIIKDGKLIELSTGAKLKEKYKLEGETAPSIDDIYMRIIRSVK